MVSLPPKPANMKIFIPILCIVILSSCSKEDAQSYPVSYTFHHVDQSDEKLYVVDAINLDTIPVNTGTYGVEREGFKTFIQDYLLMAFDLKEIELLSEDSLRIHVIAGEEEIDSVFSYSTVNGSIVIDSIQGGLLTYDKDSDQFIVCGVTTFVLAGPNVQDPGIIYEDFSIEDCTPGYSNEDYARDILTENGLLSLDTIGVILTKFIFQ